jgi:hypothetical protein
LSGTTLTLLVTPRYSISEVKAMIEYKQGIDVVFRLVFAGTLLDEEEGLALADYSIHKESTIHVVRCLAGGAAAKKRKLALADLAVKGDDAPLVRAVFNYDWQPTMWMNGLNYEDLKDLITRIESGNRSVDKMAVQFMEMTTPWKELDHAVKTLTERTEAAKLHLTDQIVAKLGHYEKGVFFALMKRRLDELAAARAMHA